MNQRLSSALGVLLVTLLMFLFIKLTIPTNLKQSTITPTASAITPTSVPDQVLGVQSKTSNCQTANNLPDPACTPGAVFPNVIKEQICQSGYSASVRNVPTSVKDQAYLEYNILTHKTGEYEVDHLISLELGGSNDLANLWPEVSNVTMGSHQKDVVENYLHRMVCSGQMELLDAQKQIETNWVAIYNQLEVK